MAEDRISVLETAREDTRVGTGVLAIPRVRNGSCYRSQLEPSDGPSGPCWRSSQRPCVHVVSTGRA